MKASSSKLRSYYCRLVNSELYFFENKQDGRVREVIVLGSEDTVHLEESKYVTQSDLNLYTVTLVQPHSKSVLYFLKKERAAQWRKSLAKLIKKEMLFGAKYKLREKIGEGAFGVVRVAHSKEGRDFAVKIISKKA